MAKWCATIDKIFGNAHIFTIERHMNIKRIAGEIPYDYVICRVTGLLWGVSTGHRWIPSQRPVTRSFEVLLDMRLNKRWSKQSRRQWFETPSRSLWRHSNEQKMHTRHTRTTFPPPVTMKQSMWLPLQSEYVITRSAWYWIWFYFEVYVTICQLL